MSVLRPSIELVAVILFTCVALLHESKIYFMSMILKRVKIKSFLCNLYCK